MPLIYTTIQHPFRKKHGLTINEYTLVDMVYHLSNNASSDVPGWCFMSKIEMGKELSFSKPTVINLTKKMVEKGFIEKHPITRHLRTTAKWQKVYFTNGKESLPTVKKVVESGKLSLLESGKESLPNNNNIYNNINNSLLSEIKISDVPSELVDYYKISLKFQELIIKNLEKRNSPAGIQKKAKFKKWVDPIRLMLTSDGVSKDNLIAAYNYLNSTNGDFWQKNILSTTNLRKNISKVLAQAHEPIKGVSDGEKSTWMQKQNAEFKKGLSNLIKNKK